jgi:hypothetical protein
MLEACLLADEMSKARFNAVTIEGGYAAWKAQKKNDD